jgi:hypothetical protein
VVALDLNDMASMGSNGVTCQLTVLFDDPFWVGLFERTDEHGYAAGCTVFGAEPTDLEIYQFICQHYATVRYSTPIPAAARPAPTRVDFKRKQRESKRFLETSPLTKAQNALRLELEKNKKVSQQESKAERDEEKERKLHLRQQKRKEKKRGH